MKLHFLGADDGVTGSRHLDHSGRLPVLAKTATAARCTPARPPARC